MLNADRGHLRTGPSLLFEGFLGGSVVNVRRWVVEGETQGMLVGAHPLTGGRPLGNGAANRPPADCDATLPGAIRLDGSITFAGNASSVQAARAGRRR